MEQTSFRLLWEPDTFPECSCVWEEGVWGQCEMHTSTCPLCHEPTLPDGNLCEWCGLFREEETCVERDLEGSAELQAAWDAALSVAAHDD